jgi:hypothetical protein
MKLGQDAAIELPLNDERLPEPQETQPARSDRAAAHEHPEGSVVEQDHGADS